MGSKRAFRYGAEAAALRGVSWLFCRLPHRGALHLGDFLGRLVGRIAPLRGRVVDGNLAAAFPGWPADRRRAVRRGLYRHLGRLLAEFLRFPALSTADILRHSRIEGEERLRDAWREGKGVMLLSAHLGNWEWLAAASVARALPLSLLVAPQRNPQVQAVIGSCRGAQGVEVLVTKRGPADLRELIRALRAGQLVGTLADQDAGRDGFFVDFLGRPASCALGPFRIARRAGAPVIFVFSVREGFNHRIVVDEPLRSDPSRDEEEEIRAWARLYHERLAAWIARHPEQWFWVHRRWKSRPAE